MTTPHESTHAWMLQFIVATLRVWDGEFARRPLPQQVEEAQWVLETMNLNIEGGR